MKSSIQSVLFIATWVATTAAVATDKDDLTICVHPYSSSTLLIQAFSPLAEYLSDKIGQRFSVHIAADDASHIKTVGTDKLGIGYMGPASYVKLVEKYGAKRILARQAIRGKPTFEGKIIVRQDSAIASLADLAGKRFAFGDPHSTMSHLVPRYMLEQAGLAGHEHLGEKLVPDLVVQPGSQPIQRVC